MDFLLILTGLFLCCTEIFGNNAWQVLICNRKKFIFCSLYSVVFLGYTIDTEQMFE